MNNNVIRNLVSGYVENAADRLEYIVDTLYKNPEISFHEEQSCKILCDILNSEGFKVTKDVGKVKYSFTAEYGSSSPKIAYICEYDAIENIGHGCGHNVTSAINIGAAIGLKRAVDEIGGSVLVIGCPGEEKHYTKIAMDKEGIFSGIDAIICGHARDKTYESGTSLGMHIIHFTFKGREAHTSLNFKDAINALSPCIMLFSLVESLKLQYSETAFINGIITNGGKEINIIPGESKCVFMVKSSEKNTIKAVCDKIVECAEFVSKNYNCDFEFVYPEAEYMPLKTHHGLSRLVCHNLKERGILNIHGPAAVPASLDIGNISCRIPTVHPYIGLSETPIKYYSKEFGDCTVTPYAKANMLKAACALALTGVDIIENEDILERDEIEE